MSNTAASREKARMASGFVVKVFGFLLLVSATCTAISVYRTSEFLANATHVNGQVVDLHSGSKGTVAPVVRFTTTAGETLQLTNYLSSSPAPNMGESVNVVYRNSNPQDWQIDDWIHLHFWTLLASIFTLAWAVAFTVTKVISDRVISKLEQPGGSFIQ